jgi:hypothetical protein
MFHESPSRMTPALVLLPPCSAAGKNELGILRSLSLSNASLTGSRNCNGSSGTIFVRM